MSEASLSPLENLPPITDETAAKRRIIGVARFSDPAVRGQLESGGIQTITGDLLDESFVAEHRDAWLRC